MEQYLRAGVAIFNEGRYHAAHDAWEDHWLDLEAGTDDELLLHGLIQFTAVVHHAERENWAGVEGLAESAREYLRNLPATYRGIDLDPVREFLDRAARDPEGVDSDAAPDLVHHGQTLRYPDLDFEATAVAVTVIAEANGFCEGVVEDAVEYARGEVDVAGGGTFTGLLFSFVRDSDRRPVVFDRLLRHVERERSKDADVDGLFEE